MSWYVFFGRTLYNRLSQERNCDILGSWSLTLKLIRVLIIIIIIILITQRFNSVLFRDSFVVQESQQDDLDA